MFQLSPPDHRVSNSIPITRLPIGSLPLQPADLLDSLDEPLSGNSVPQVTLNTSLQLRGRTAEFPRPDFNWQVMCHTRHTVRFRYFLIFLLRPLAKSSSKSLSLCANLSSSLIRFSFCYPLAQRGRIASKGTPWGFELSQPEPDSDED